MKNFLMGVFARVAGSSCRFNPLRAASTPASLFLCITALAGPPTPPGFSPSSKVLSPKGAELTASLGSPMVMTSPTVAPAISFSPGFIVTNIAVIGGTVSLAWQSGTPPFQVEGTTDFQNWIPVFSTSNQFASFPAGQNHFWRVAAVPAPPDVQPFATNIGGSLNDSCNAVARDAQGNVWVAGYFSQTMFIQKRGPSGELLWGTVVNAANPTCLSVDGSGNVLVGGMFLGTANFGGQDVTNHGQYDCFIAKYSSSGEFIWVKAFGSAGSDSVTGIAANGSAIVACGFFRGAATIDEHSIDSTGLFMSWIASFDSSGHCTWVRPGNPSAVFAGSNFARAVDVDTNGNVSVIGYAASGALNFGCGSLNFPSTKGYVAKFDGNGACLWARNYGSDSSNTRFWSGRFAGNGDVLVLGDFQFSTDLGGGTITGGSSALDAFSARFSGADGYYIAATSITAAPGPSIINPLSCTVDASDNFTVAGSLMGTYSSGGQALSSAGGIQRGFVLRFNPSLSAVWSRVFIGAGQSQLSGLWDAGAIGCYLGGNFGGSDSFNGLTLNSAGGFDGCLILTK